MAVRNGEMDVLIGRLLNNIGENKSKVIKVEQAK